MAPKSNYYRYYDNIGSAFIAHQNAQIDSIKPGFDDDIRLFGD